MEVNTNLSAENKENEINVFSDSQLSRREQLELWKQSKQGTKKPTQPQKPEFKRRSDIFIVDKEPSKTQTSASSVVQPKKDKSLPRASLQPQQIQHVSTVAPKSNPTDLKKLQSDKRKSMVPQKTSSLPRNSIIPQEKPEITTSRSSIAITPGRQATNLNSASTPGESISMSREERLKLWRLEKEKQKIEELQAEIAKATKTVLKKQQQFGSAKKQQPTVSLRAPVTPSAKSIIQLPSTDLTQLRTRLEEIMNLQSPDEVRQQFEDLLSDPSLPEVNLVAEYWVTRARFEEQQRNFAEVVRLYEQASQMFAQPIRDVEEGLRAFMLRLKDSYISKFKRCAEELAEFQERSEFDSHFSTTVDFSNPSQHNSPSKTRTATEEQMQLIKDLVDTLSSNPLTVEEVQQEAPANVAAQTNAAVNIIEQAFQAQPASVTSQVATPVSQPVAPSQQPISIDSLSLDKYLQIEDSPVESEEDPSELLFNDPVLRILTPPRKNRKSSLAMRKSTPKPQRVVIDEEDKEADEKTEEQKPAAEQPLESSVVVLAPVPASQKQKKALGSAKILTPVRRSTRLSTSTRMVPLNDESLSQVLEETGYAYSPNLSVQKKNKGFKVMFAENLPSQQPEEEEEDEDEFAKYLRTPVSKPPQTPSSAIATETYEQEIQTSPLEFPVQHEHHEHVVQRLFTDSNEEHETPALEEEPEQEHDDEVKPEEVQYEENHEEYHSVKTPFSELGRYDTLAPIVKSGHKSGRKSVRIVAEETPSRKSLSSSWHSRRKSTPCPSRVQSSSPVAITPVRRSVRLSAKKSNAFDLNDPHGPVTFTPNRFIPDLAEYLKPEVEHLIKDNPQ